MSKKKILTAILVAFTLVALQVGAVFAAPSQQTTDPPTTPTPAPTSSSITGTVDSVNITTDSTGATIVEVTLTDANGVQQTINLTVQQAFDLGLVTSTTDPQVVDPLPTDPITITQSTTSTDTNPVASLIEDFFMTTFPNVGLTSGDVMTWHEDGNGFGVIAQACFMAAELQTDCQSVIDAKNGDFSKLGELPSNVTNWGQLKKYAFQQAVSTEEYTFSKSMTNLGAIVSGRASKDTTNTNVDNPSADKQNGLLSQSSHGKGGGRGKGNHGKGH